MVAGVLIVYNMTQIVLLCCQTTRSKGSQMICLLIFLNRRNLYGVGQEFIHLRNLRRDT